MAKELQCQTKMHQYEIMALKNDTDLLVAQHSILNNRRFNRIEHVINDQIDQMKQAASKLEQKIQKVPNIKDIISIISQCRTFIKPKSPFKNAAPQTRRNKTLEPHLHPASKMKSSLKREAPSYQPNKRKYVERKVQYIEKEVKFIEKKVKYQKKSPSQAKNPQQLFKEKVPGQAEVQKNQEVVENVVNTILKQPFLLKKQKEYQLKDSKNLCAFESAILVLCRLYDHSGTFYEKCVSINKESQIIVNVRQFAETLNAELKKQHFKTFDMNAEQDPANIIQWSQSLLQASFKKTQIIPILSKMNNLDCHKTEVMIASNIAINTWEIQEDLTYQRKCIFGKQHQFKIDYLPNNFIVINQSEQQDARSMFYPLLRKNYYDSIVQYDPQQRHFRYVKRTFQHIQIYDNGRTIIRPSSQIKQIINDNKYINYIYVLSRKKNSVKLYSPKKIITSHKLHKCDYKGKGKQGDEIQPKSFKEDHQPREGQLQSIIRILQWNVNKKIEGQKEKACQKRRIIKELEPDICFIIENFKEFSLNSAYTSLHSLPAVKKQKKINCTICFKNSIDIQLKTTQVNYISAVGRGFPFVNPTLLIAAYLNPAKNNENLGLIADTLDTLFKQITVFQADNTNCDIIVGGDFNYTTEEMQNHQHPIFDFLLDSLYKSAEPYTSLVNRTREIDHIFCSTVLTKKHIPQEYQRKFEGLSNHAPVICQIKGIIRETKFTIPSKLYAKQFCSHLIKSGKPITPSFISNHKETFDSKHKKCTTIQGLSDKGKKIQLKPIQELEFRKMAENFTRFSEDLAQKRFCPNQKQAFDTLKRTFKYHTFNKRQGGIVNKAMLQGREVINEELSIALLEHFESIHKILPNPLSAPPAFPQLNLTKQEIIQMTKNVCKNIAISLDGFHDCFFHQRFNCTCRIETPWSCSNCQRRLQILDMLAKPEFYNVNNFQDWGSSFLTRLIPLNKCHPKAPTISDYRPIIVTSPIIKFLQGTIMKELRQYACSRLNRRQFGFIPRIGIEQAKFELCTYIKKLAAAEQQEKYVLMFFDFSNAYDRVDRAQLYRQLQTRKTLTPPKLQLLKFIHYYTKTTINCDQQHLISTNNGVPQGFSSSPLCFDVYTESLLENLEAIPNCQPIMYADDLVIGVKISDIQKILGIIEKWSSQMNMAVNKKKCGILPLDLNHMLPLQINNYPVVESYKYLGTNITRQCNMNFHIKSIEKKITFISIQLRPLVLKGYLRLNVNLFKTFIIPQYRLAFMMFQMSTTHEKIAMEKSLRKHFKRFCCLPQGTPNKILNKLISTIDELSKSAEVYSDCKLKSHKQYRNLKKQQIQKIIEAKKTTRTFKYLPSSIHACCRVMYASKCSECKTILNSEHLTTKHGFRCTIHDILDRIQTKKYRNSAKSDAKALLKLAEKLQLRKNPQMTSQ